MPPHKLPTPLQSAKGVKFHIKRRSSNGPQDEPPKKRQRTVLGKSIEALNPEDLKTLEPGQWVNNEVVNLYLDHMIRALPGIENRVHVFNPLFYKDLNEDLKAGQTIEYKNAQRWAKDNLFQCKYMVVPIYEKLHWYVLIIHYDGGNK